jgi:hypothetical protein
MGYSRSEEAEEAGTEREGEDKHSRVRQVQPGKFAARRAAARAPRGPRQALYASQLGRCQLGWDLRTRVMGTGCVVVALGAIQVAEDREYRGFPDGP